VLELACASCKHHRDVCQHLRPACCAFCLQATSGAGGVLVDSGTEIALRSVTLEDNICEQDAGGLTVLAAAQLHMHNVTVMGNQVSLGVRA